MVGFVIWIVGLVLTIKAALEIWRIHAPIERRLIAIILIVLTSWIGLLFYYFYGKARMPQWLGTGVQKFSYIRKQYLYEYNSKHGRVQQKSIATLPKFPSFKKEI